MGRPEAKPDYGYVGWFSMPFAAGMGIGLMVFGVSEPIAHFDSAMARIAVGDDGLRTGSAPLGCAECEKATPTAWPF